MKTIEILSRHSSLASAVAAAGIDLSYNEPLARANITELDFGNVRNGFKPVTQAFVVDAGIDRTGSFAVDIWYVLDAGKHGVLFNKYTPFHGCLHDGAFSFAVCDGDKVTITGPISKDRALMIKHAKLLASGSQQVWITK